MEVEAYLMPTITFWVLSALFLAIGFCLGMAVTLWMNTQKQGSENA